MQLPVQPELWLHKLNESPMTPINGLSARLMSLKLQTKQKSVPLDWITKEGNDVTAEMTAYLRPLIIGEVSLQYKDGLPVYLPVDHLLH